MLSKLSHLSHGQKRPSWEDSGLGLLVTEPPHNSRHDVPLLSPWKLELMLIPRTHISFYRELLSKLASFKGQGVIYATAPDHSRIVC